MSVFLVGEQREGWASSHGVGLLGWGQRGGWASSQGVGLLGDREKVGLDHQ